MIIECDIKSRSSSDMEDKFKENYYYYGNKIMVEWFVFIPWQNALLALKELQL
jgi:hypothetical protein